MMFFRLDNRLRISKIRRFFKGLLLLTFVSLFVVFPLHGSQAVASENENISVIKDLLADRNNDGKPDKLGENVTVRGRTTAGTNILNDQYLLFYIQDSTAGIMVFSDTLDIAVQKGDSLQITGTLKLHASKPEIVVEDLEVVQAKKRIPKAKPLRKAFKNPKRYRGLLVNGEAVVEGNSPLADTKMLQIAPTDGADDSLHIFVSRSNLHYEDFNFDALGIGDRIHINGILIRYTSGYTGKTLYQILPRTPDDLIINNLQPMVSEGSFIYTDIDTTQGMVYMLLKDGLWGYDLSNNSWDFLNPLENFKGALSTYEFGYNTQTNLIQLWSRGMGELFTIDPETFQIEKQDRDSEHHNQFGHFPFFRDSTLHAFGGYGFWDYHNMIVHFNQSRAEWELQNVNRNSSYPSRRVPQTGVYDSQRDRLYIFGGRGTVSENSENQNLKSQEYRDIWTFSFESQEWQKVMTATQLENDSRGYGRPSIIGKINNQSSSVYLPGEQMWLIPTYDPDPLFETFSFRTINLSSNSENGLISPDFIRSGKFAPTNYHYFPEKDEVVFIGVKNVTNATAYPVGVHQMPADSLMAKISDTSFYLSNTAYYVLIGLAIFGGALFLFYRNQAANDKKIEEDTNKIPLEDSFIQASWLNEREKKLLTYMKEHDHFMESQEIEELLWSDIESYDYRRRLRNDILKDINQKFKKHHPDLGKLILRKKDPNDKRRYLYGLNKQLVKE